MVTYANTVCGTCLAPHAVNHHLTESLATKRRAKEIVFHLMQIYNKTGMGAGALTNAEREARFVFGVLVAGAHTLVGVSGVAVPANFAMAVGRIPGVNLVGAVAAPVRTYGGTVIAPGVIVACQAPGANVPLSCAAPKLIVAANLLHAAGGAAAPNVPYAMSEVWCDPRQWERRTAVTATRNEAAINAVFTDHGQSRLSCATCQNLLPLLMCPN
ncbi:MAG: hypothetical protein ACLPY1_09050 [Terracidiphilus sp.]